MMPRMLSRPSANDAARYYSTYIDQVPDGNIVEILAKQRGEFDALLRSIPEIGRASCRERV